MRLLDSWGQVATGNRRVYLYAQNVLVMFATSLASDMPTETITAWIAAHDSLCRASSPEVIHITTAGKVGDLSFPDWSAEWQSHPIVSTMSGVMWRAEGILA